MLSIPPLTMVFVILVSVALAGAVAAYVRDRVRFSGYRELTAEALRIARALHGEVFRDGADLVITGAWDRWPVMVRFSYSENTPGLSIRMGAPATFSLSVAPSRAEDAAGRVVLRTADEIFNTRFTIRSDDPMQARLFLDRRQASVCLRKLCRSAEHYLTVQPGLLELDQLGLPTRQTIGGLMDDVATLGSFAAELRAMPGAEAVRIEALSPKRSLVLRLALALGVVAATASIFMAAHPSLPESRGWSRDLVPAGVWPSDASHMQPLANWRLAQADDFDPAAIAWLRNNGQRVSGRIPGDYCGSGPEDGVAYVLVGGGNSRRLVLLCRRQNRYDVIYPSIGLVARVPKQVFGTIKWTGNAPLEPDGDGLLLVRSSDSPASGLVFFTRGGQINTAVPLNYESIKLE
jgi:hypothetical protein